eukprot:5052210-Alexandrium_andersonii.AAC.1
MEHVRGPIPPLASVPLHPVQGKPPCVPNAYTDGSVVHPCTRVALGAFAVWCPCRGVPASEVESVFSHVDHGAGSLR